MSKAQGESVFFHLVGKYNQLHILSVKTKALRASERLFASLINVKFIPWLRLCIGKLQTIC